MFMVGTLDAFEFHLAEKLGMTVHHMREVMPNAEYEMWRAFYDYRDAMYELESKKAATKRQM